MSPLGIMLTVFDFQVHVDNDMILSECLIQKGASCQSLFDAGLGYGEIFARQLKRLPDSLFSKIS